MPTWVNHFRVADRLLDKIKNLDVEYFIIGNIAPDCGKLDKSHGVYKPYTGITHFTKDIEYSKKTDCDYDYIYSKYVKSETDIKKKSFFMGYYIHLFTDCIFAQNVFMPIETAYGDFRYNENLRKQVQKERNNVDFMFLANNKSPSFEIFKKCKSFKEPYPEWYKNGEIAWQMKNIVEFYSNPKFEIMEYEYISPQIMDDFVDVTIDKLCEEIRLKDIRL